MKKIKVASLFSGIGGFELGLKRAGLPIEVVFSSEIDRFARKSYNTIFNIEPEGDITKIHEFLVPDHDLLVAGFPCQAFSIAGKRKGFEDTRGTLFFEIARILNWKRPKFILLENVKNLITHDNRNTINTILKVLSDIGYSLDFDVLNSKNYGVPQNRERTYIIGILDGPREKWTLNSIVPNVNDVKSQILKKNHIKMMDFEFHKIKITKGPNLEKVLEGKVQEKYFLEDNIINKITKEQNDFRNEGFTQNNEIVKIFDIPRWMHKDNERQRRVYSTQGIAPTVLARSDTAKILVKHKNRYRIRKLTPLECFRLQGFPDEVYFKLVNNGLSDTQLYKQAGNAVTVNVVKGISSKLGKYLLNVKSGESIV